MNVDDNPGVRMPPPLIFAGFILGGLVVDGLLELHLPDGSSWARWGAAAITGTLGLWLLALALSGFARARIRPEPWQAARSLNQAGIYNRTRNPMYFGMACLHVSIALALGSPGALALVVPALTIINRSVIRREEAYLTRRFGAEYETYKARVPRWF